MRQQQQELEHSCTELKLAVAGKERAEQSLQQTRAQLEESSAGLERLRREVLRQQEQSEHGEAVAILGFRTAALRALPRLLMLQFTRGAHSHSPIRSVAFIGTAGNLVARPWRWLRERDVANFNSSKTAVKMCLIEVLTI